MPLADRVVLITGATGGLGKVAARAFAAAGARLGLVDTDRGRLDDVAGDFDPDEVRTMLDQHLWTTLGIARDATPGMVERGWGRFVAISFAHRSRLTAGAVSLADD
jgi:NAD(P)-dependent dehydrogenase (short-subunit alcohol dehydrogenase family)